MKFILTEAEAQAVTRQNFNLSSSVDVEITRESREPNALGYDGINHRTLMAAIPVFHNLKEALSSRGPFAASIGVGQLNKIEAIKSLRSVVSGLGLAEAKQIVETFWNNY